MFIRYIDKNGNWGELNEVQNPGRMSRFHKSDSGVWYENYDVPKASNIVIESEKETEENYDIYREYLKSNKIKGYQLLKGENIKKKAIEHGYI